MFQRFLELLKSSMEEVVVATFLIVFVLQLVHDAHFGPGPAAIGGAVLGLIFALGALALQTATHRLASYSYNTANQLSNGIGNATAFATLAFILVVASMAGMWQWNAEMALRWRPPSPEFAALIGVISVLVAWAAAVAQLALLAGVLKVCALVDQASSNYSRFM